jgi:phosphoserine phosphatase
MYIIISLAELSLAVADRGYSEVVVSAGFTLCTKTIIFELCEPFGVGNHSK